MVDQRKGNRLFSHPTTNMEEVHHRSWKETTIIGGLTIVAAVYARRLCAPAWRSFKAIAEAAMARAEAKARAEAAKARAEAAKARAEAAKARAEAAKARVDAAKARAESARADAAKARAESAKAKAESAKAKAEAAGAGASDQKNYPGGFQNTMTTKEATLILGIGESSTKDEVKEAHRRVIFKNHPDAGGSGYLASKINQAKDILMKKIENR